MIRALAHREGRPVVLLGLSKINLDRLLLDRPILSNLRTFVGEETTLPDIDVVVFFDDDTNTGEDLMRYSHARRAQDDLRPIQEANGRLQRWVSRHLSELPEELLKLLSDLDWTVRPRC